MVVKTYRGMLIDGAQERIPLSTKDGSVGYRITKFQIMSGDAIGSIESSSLVTIWKEEQSTAEGTVDFTATDLLAASEYRQHDNEAYGVTGNTTIFDTEIFNRDIYIINKDNSVGAKMNYYIELEQMKLDHTQNMSVTLKAIRGSALD